MFVSLMQVCIVYVVKEVASVRGARSINGAVCNITCAQAIQTSRKKAACSLDRNWN